MVFWRAVFRARLAGNTAVSSTARRRPCTPAPTRTLFARRRCATVYVGVPYFYCARPPAVIDRRCSRPAAATDIIFTGPAKADRRARTSVSVIAAPNWYDNATGRIVPVPHFSRPPFRVNRILRWVAPPFPSTAAFRFANLGTPEPRGCHHGQAQHGHERHRVRMGIRQGEGWPNDMAKDHHGHIQSELAWVSRPVRKELGWI